MSRKARQDQSNWKLPSIQIFNVGYSSFRTKNVEAIENALVWFYNSSNDADYLVDQQENKRNHPLYSSAGLLQDLLLRKQNNYRFSCMICIDLADICKDEEENEEDNPGEEELSSYDKAIVTEIEEIEVSKRFGKKILRLLHRLILQKAIIVGQGSFCAVLIKLYKILFMMDPDIVSELWLLHPNIPKKFVNTHLVVNDGFTVEIYESLKLNLIFESEKNNRVGVLQYYFPSLQKFVIAEPKNWFHIIAHAMDSPQKEESEEEDQGDYGEYSYDPECFNDIGERLFLAHMKVEMNPYSKQYERNSFDITDSLIEVFEEEEPDVLPLNNIDFTKVERHVGALVLRGNRCILVRSISNEWRGMRIPSVPFPEEEYDNESPHEAAIRAVEEYADVEPSEVKVIPHVPPVMIYAPNGRPILMELYPL